jgi:hypothetical protein
MLGRGMRLGRPGKLHKLFDLLSVRERDPSLPGIRDDNRASAVAQLLAWDGAPIRTGDEDDSWWGAEDRYVVRE